MPQWLHFYSAEIKCDASHNLHFALTCSLTTSLSVEGLQPWRGGRGSAHHPVCDAAPLSC